jgi:beta-glucosidase-like glycosyl hydrolase
MKSIARHYAIADAGVLAIEAGCDGVLICSSDHDVQARTLEALIHAVEDERLARSAVDDILKRHRRAKERFLTTTISARRAGRTWQAVVGRDQHRTIADEMARFV